mgnify:CR=1 FL=1
MQLFNCSLRFLIVVIGDLKFKLFAEHINEYCWSENKPTFYTNSASKRG